MSNPLALCKLADVVSTTRLTLSTARLSLPVTLRLIPQVTPQANPVPLVGTPQDSPAGAARFPPVDPDPFPVDSTGCPMGELGGGRWVATLSHNYTIFGPQVYTRWPSTGYLEGLTTG